MPITIDVYTPIPYISAVVKNNTVYTVSGTLNEPLAGEPIHTWRIRASTAPELLSKNATMTDASGFYSSQFAVPTESIRMTTS